MGAERADEFIDHDSLSGDQSAWQCSLTRQDFQSPPAVRYLQLADGTIKFTGMRSYKAAAPPGR